MLGMCGQVWSDCEEEQERTARASDRVGAQYYLIGISGNFYSMKDTLSEDREDVRLCSSMLFVLIDSPLFAAASILDSAIAIFLPVLIHFLLYIDRI
jgi:hypothetical protein